MQPDSKNHHRKRKNFEDDQGSHEMAHDESNWLVSYADMMTLLFGFFVLMYSFSKLDKEKFNSVRENLTTYFGGTMEEGKEIVQMKDDLKQVMGEVEVDANDFNVSTTPSSLVLKLNSDLVFASGSAEIAPQFKDVLKVAMKTIMGKREIDKISVEGHTDSIPINSFIYPSNWELSTARSSRVVRQLIDLGINAKLLTAQGFGDSRPLVPNKSADGKILKENLKKNRRVVIKVDFGRSLASAQEVLKNKQFIKEKNSPKKRIETNSQKASETLQQRGAASKTNEQLAQDPKLNNSSIQAETVKNKKAMPMDLLKERLMKAQKEFEEANKEARERQKREAARKKMLEKIEQLENKTKELKSN